MSPPSTPEPRRSAGPREQAQRRPTDAAGRGTGLPVRHAQAERQATGEPLTAKDASLKSSIRLPHERDEDAAMTNHAVQPRMRQAAQDLERGLKDTSRAPESDQAYHRLHEEGPASPARASARDNKAGSGPG